MTQTASLRRYPYPGKYEGGLLIDELVHGLSLDGWAASDCGDVSECGVYYARIDGAIDSWTADQCPADAEPNLEETAYLAGIAGVIVREDSQGFVSVEYFETPEALENRWRACMEETAPEAEDE